MGEIKSTFDIVMEKARGITVSEDEKKEFQMREIRGRVRGFFQKYMDGAVDVERIRKELDGLAPDKREMAKGLFKEESAAMFRLQGNNGPILDLLKDVSGVETSKIEEALSLSLSALIRERSRHEKRLLERLKDKGISGSAIAPNPDADPEWKRIVSDMETELRGKVKKLI